MRRGTALRVLAVVAAACVAGGISTLVAGSARRAAPAPAPVVPVPASASATRHPSDVIRARLVPPAGGFVRATDATATDAAVQIDKGYQSSAAYDASATAVYRDAAGHLAYVSVGHFSQPLDDAGVAAAAQQAATGAQTTGTTTVAPGEITGLTGGGKIAVAVLVRSDLGITVLQTGATPAQARATAEAEARVLTPT